MAQSTEKLPPASGWQVTECTIWWPLVEARVNVRIKNDWRSYCCWYREFNKEDFHQKLDSRVRAKLAKCKGHQCSYIADYRDKLIREEFEDKEK